MPWTCETCGTHYAGTTLTVPVLGVRRIPPPAIGDCGACKEREHQAFMARLQREENQRISRWFLRNSEIGPAYQGCTFENYRPLPGTEAALTRAREFAERFEEPDGQWLLLFGPPGNGKTHLGMAVRNQVDQRFGVMSLAITQPYLLQEIRASWDRRQGDEDTRSESWILEKLQTAPFVLIDDLMAWREWADDRMFVLLDGRYRNKRKTVFTSNHTPEQLEEILGPRMWSRFAARTVMVRNGATDYRVNVERKAALGPK